MVRDDCEFMIDNMAKFHKYLFIAGWFYRKKDKIRSLNISNISQISSDIKINTPHAGVEKTFGRNKGFVISILRTSSGAIPKNASLTFTLESGKKIRANLLDLAADRISRYPTSKMSRDFIQRINSLESPTLLDIGGRARSRIDRSQSFPNADVTVLDILAGENVDVVGDAHDLSSLFPPDHFDAVLSVSVFEHLLMPWRVVGEMNKVLKMGGIGYIHTHQTLGMHDVPWDFWRFSDTSWDALLNEKTGFRILDRALDSEQYIIPFVYRPSKATAERSVGFEGSAVVFEKIGPCLLNWDVPTSSITNSIYPDNDDGQMADQENFF